MAIQAVMVSAVVAMASESSGTRPRWPTIAVSARLYAGSAAIDPSAGSASTAIRRSSSRSGRVRLLPPVLTTPQSALLGLEAEKDQVGGACCLQGEKSGSRGTKQAR